MTDRHDRRLAVDDLIERLRAVKWEEIDEGDRMPDDFSALLREAAAALNDEVPWAELGFVCDGRFLFSQRSLERAPLPASFTRFLPGQCDDAA